MPRGKHDHSGPRGPYTKLYAVRERTPLAKARLAHALTQKQAAEQLGMDRAQYAGYESGARRWPRRSWRSRKLLDRLDEFMASAPNVTGDRQ